MENIGIGYQIPQEALKQMLTELFPGLQFHYWNREDNERVPENTILYTYFVNKSEFPVNLDLYGFPNDHVEEREQYIARQLSIRLSCCTIVPYQEKGSSYPYHCVIFDKGKSYLADDSETLWADNEGGPVKIIEPIQLIEYQFDLKGNSKRIS